MIEESRTPTPEAGAHALPRQTTPTWEVELLISGVAVFAMLQLPGLLDDAIFAWRPRFGADWAMPLIIVYLYAKSAAVVLAGTFVVHLMLRARWIALVGMLSVHPDGVAWDRLGLGPIARAIEERRMGSIEAVIERADNRATTVFAIGVTLASLFVVLTLVVGGAMLLALVLGVRPDTNLLLGATALFVVPFALAQLADRRFGARLPPGGTSRRVVAAVLETYARVGFGNARNPVFALLASHSGRRRVVVQTSATMMLVAIGVSAAYFAMREPDSFGSYARFPDAGEGTLLASHYDDQRDPARDRADPFVQSAVVSGPFLRLTVPYQPDRDEPAMQRRCPDARSGTLPARTDPLLQCLQQLHAVALDGRPIAASYETGADPRTGRPALVAMIDVRALARGRHELRIARPAAVGKHDDDERGDSIIPFWR